MAWRNGVCLAKIKRPTMAYLWHQRMYGGGGWRNGIMA